jgi:hypothetical protein
MHGVVHLVHAAVRDRVAGLYRDFVDPKPFATKLQHFGHEWKRLQLPMFIKRCKYLLGAQHLYNVVYVEFSGLVR